MSFLYNSAKQDALSTGMNLDTKVVEVILVDSADYIASAAHAALADIPVAARVATTTLSSKTIANGIFDAANSVFSSVTGDASENLVIRNATDDKLIAFIDGITVTPNGNNINCNWDPAGIFAL